MAEAGNSGEQVARRRKMWAALLAGMATGYVGLLGFWYALG
jgi:alcohol dehydrogenase class IV